MLLLLLLGIHLYAWGNGSSRSNSISVIILDFVHNQETQIKEQVVNIVVYVFVAHSSLAPTFLY